MVTVVIGDNTGDDYSGTEDSRMQETAYTTNYGSATEYEIQSQTTSNRHHVCLKFSGISNLPSSLSVTSSVVSLYLNLSFYSGNQTITCNRLLRNWVESQVTWDDYATSAAWTSGGATSDGNDRDGTSAASVTHSESTGYKNFSDTSQIQGEVEDFADGTLTNYGWVFYRSDTASDLIRLFTSSEGTDGERPYLTVTYTTTGGSTPKFLTLLGVG